MNDDALTAEFLALKAAFDSAFAVCRAFDSEDSPEFVAAFLTMQRAKAACVAHPCADKWSAKLRIVSSGP